MITYNPDMRDDASTRDRIDEVLDSLVNNVTVAALLGNTAKNIIYTTLKPDGTGITSTGITPTTAVALPMPFGPGLDYSGVTGLGQVNFDTWLLVEQAYVDNDGGSFSVFSGGQDLSLTRIFFHELTHTFLNWSMTIHGVSTEEELSVFLENTIYRKIASELGQDDGESIRYGHSGVEFSGNGSSGVAAFEQYIQSATATIQFDRSRSIGDVATFVAEDGAYKLTKVYHNGGHFVHGFGYDHYITLTEEKSGGSYVSVTTTGYLADLRLDQVVADLMHGAVHVGLMSAVSALKAVSSFANTTQLSLSRITGVGADATTLTKFTGSGTNLVATDMLYVGPAESGTSGTADIIAIDDTTATTSSLIIGGAGYNRFSGGTDVLEAGHGNDVLLASGFGGNDLFGNDGHDILVGTSGLDNLHGGIDDDILVGGGGTNLLDGGAGSDTAYYGDRSSGIIVYDGLGKVEHDGVLDNVVDVERFIGTAHRDIFVGDGQHHIFFGNGGNDKFLASNSADTFLGTGTQWLRRDEVSFEALTAAIQINAATGTTTDGHAFGYVSSITGTTHDDDFTNSGLSAAVRLYGGLGDDTFEIGSNTHAYGGADDDTFILTELLPGMVFDGGDGYDQLDLSQLVQKTTVDLDLQAGTLQVYDDTFDISTFENFDLTGNGFTIRLTDDDETITAPVNPAQWYGFIYGRGGDDTITAGDYDYVYGGTGDDTIHMAGIGYAYGGDNDDIIDTTGQAMLYGEGGDDILTGSNFNSMLNGGSGDDILIGNGGSDQLWAGTGNNFLHGGTGGWGANSEFDFAFLAGTGRGQPGGVKAIFQNAIGDFVVVKDALNLDGSYQTDILRGVETIAFESYMGNQDVLNLIPGTTYFAPDYLI